MVLIQFWCVCEMDRKWIYAVFGLIMIGAVLAAGSIAVGRAPHSTVAEKFGEVDSANEVTRAVVGNYTQWLVVTYGGANEPYLLYTVPKGARFQIDEIVVSNYDAGNVSVASVRRGPLQSQFIMEIPLMPFTPFSQHFEGLILRTGEQIRVYSDGPCVWTISGHRF